MAGIDMKDAKAVEAADYLIGLGVAGEDLDVYIEEYYGFDDEDDEEEDDTEEDDGEDEEG